LPHELYFDLVPLVRQLDSLGIQAILSHPERNMGLLAQPHAVEALVSQGCLIQVTCGSLTGTFGTASEKMSEWLLSRGLVHFLASDGHGVKARRPKMAKAYHKATNLVGDNLAREICAANPADVTLGRTIKPGKRSVAARSRGGWFARRRVG
jgi:protein-tyrosine phosphatase